MNRIVQTPEYTYCLRTEAHGLRERPEDLATKQPGEKRIFFIGDSFVAGTGLSTGQVLTEQCRRWLRLPTLRLINAGASGTGPLQYHHALRRVAIPLGADMAVVFLYVGNDLENTHEAYTVFPYSLKNHFKRWFPNTYTWLWIRRETRPTQSCRQPRKTMSFDAWNNDTLRQWARREGIGMTELSQRLERLPQSVCSAAKAGRINPAMVYSALVHPQILEDTAGLDSQGMKTAMQRVQRMLQKMKARCDKAGIPMAVVLVPAGYQLQDGQEKFLRRLGFHTDPEKIMRKEPQRALTAFCRRRDIPCLDLLPVLRGTRMQRMYYPQDGHWRAPTVRYAAKAVGNFLKEHMP